MMQRPLRSAHENARGFTLIEMMIAVAVVVILAAIALPQYQNAVRKGNRADAKAILMEQGQYMERWFTTNNTYAGAALLSAVSPKGAATANKKYDINWQTTPTATVPSVYIVRAVPVGAQLADPCGTLTLSNTGAQVAATADCW